MGEAQITNEEIIIKKNQIIMSPFPFHQTKQDQTQIPHQNYSQIHYTQTSKGSPINFFTILKATKHSISAAYTLPKKTFPPHISPTSK
jgi:hypothetical protein